MIKIKRDKYCDFFSVSPIKVPRTPGGTRAIGWETLSHVI
jgi:hypothetical protein